MQTETMLALQSCLKRDESKENQTRQMCLVRMILKINQDVVRKGLMQIEHYKSETADFPMLWKGLTLVRGGMEPQDVVSILRNMAVANQVDLLESLLVIDGVQSIQYMRFPDQTKEWLFSHFHVSMHQQLTMCLKDLDIDAWKPLCGVLSKEEIEKLLERV